VLTNHTIDGDATVDLAVYQVGRLRHSALLPVELVPSAGNTHWEIVLGEPFAAWVDDACHVVGRGFIYDGASIRYRAVNAVIPRYGRDILPAATLHDWYYSDGRHLIPPGVSDRRLWCDRLFVRALELAGVNAVRRRLAYRAVRLFGGRVWSAGERVGFDSPAMTKEVLKINGVSDYAKSA
jgi:hypothetical protein